MLAECNLDAIRQGKIHVKSAELVPLGSTRWMTCRGAHRRHSVERRVCAARSVDTASLFWTTSFLAHISSLPLEGFGRPRSLSTLDCDQLR